MSDSASAHIFRSLSRKTGLSEDKIEPSSELLANLGLDGDDAAEFFEDLSRHFGTDLSALQKEWSRYFRPEPTIVSLFRGKRSASLRPITVEDVVLAVERGAW